MEVQQQHSPVGVGPLDFSRRGVAEASAFRVVKPKQPASSLVHQQPLPPETNNNENLQENPQIPIDSEGKKFVEWFVEFKLLAITIIMQWHKILFFITILNL